jgi:3',5'-cyclic AMP phosphodiesterase CpdA
MDRRKFIRAASPLWLALSNGSLLRAANNWYDDEQRRKAVLRIAVASDGHYGQKDTPYDEMYAALVKRINEEHRRLPFHFTVINGDIIHDDPSFLSAAKKWLDQLEMPYYVSQGNHDHSSPELWQQTWNMPVNLDFSRGPHSFFIATTSNVKGEYLCPDIQWLDKKLTEHGSKQHAFLFLHINPASTGDHSVKCDEWDKLISRHTQIRAVFNGHDHMQDTVLMKGNLPFVFDGHFGGNWGKPYKGFRVVELWKDHTLASYMMDPNAKINPAKLYYTQ